jgi:hypothetical protein
MKKRKPLIVVLSLIVVLTMVIFVQPIQSLALEVLSVFRVRDVNAINISISDIEQLTEGLSTIMKTLGDKIPGDKAPGDKAGMSEIHTLPDAAANFESPFTPFDSPDDFDAFNLKLPHLLRSETPQLQKLDGSVQSFMLHPDEINAVLAMLDALPIPDGLDGLEIEIMTPAVAVAAYSDTIMIATQATGVTGDEDALDALRTSFLSMPMISDNLRFQLASVDLQSGIVYVPVIEGFGRRTTIGNSTGYLYAVSDLETLLDSIQTPDLPNLPDFPGLPELPELPELPDSYGQLPDDAQVLIWASDSVLYILISARPTSEIIRIAGSLK